LPWMFTCEEDEEFDFEVKLQSISDEDKYGKPLKNAEKGWSIYLAEFRKISVQDVEDGEHEVPFWAMNAFADWVEESGEEKGWLKGVFVRSEGKKGNEATFASD